MRPAVLVDRKGKVASSYIVNDPLTECTGRAVIPSLFLHLRSLHAI